MAEKWIQSLHPLKSSRFLLLSLEFKGAIFQKNLPRRCAACLKYGGRGGKRARRQPPLVRFAGSRRRPSAGWGWGGWQKRGTIQSEQKKKARDRQIVTVPRGVWSECGDSNPGPPAPKAGALPTAQHPDMKLWDCLGVSSQSRRATNCATPRRAARAVACAVPYYIGRRRLRQGRRLRAGQGLQRRQRSRRASARRARAGQGVMPRSARMPARMASFCSLYWAAVALSST